MNPTDQPLTDPQTQEVIHCERCESVPATQEICYHDSRFSSREDGIAWDLVCPDCAQEAHAKGETLDR